MGHVAPEEPPAPSPKPQAEAIPGVATQSWPDHLLRSAWENFGIGIDEARSFGTPANLERALGVLQSRVSQNPQPRTDTPTPEAEDSLPWEYPAGENGLFTPEGAEWFKQRDAHFAAENKKLREELASVKQQSQQAQQVLQQQSMQAQVREFSEVIQSATPEEYRDLVGKSYHDCTQEQWQRQAQVHAAVRARDLVNQEQGRRESLKDMYIRVLRAEFPEVQERTRSQRVSQQERDIAGQFISRPTSVDRSGNTRPRAMSEVDKTRRAEEAVAAELRKQGREVLN